MTFYEAALRVLESAGHPLHVLEITEKSISQNLLSHVGKTPEQTMLSRLAAMARRNRDRRMIVTARDTFGLIEWGVPENVDALSVTGVPEPNPEDDLPPLRPAERHPEPRADFTRGAGRTERQGRSEDDDEKRRRRRFPPVSEVAFEILSEAGQPLSPQDLLAKGKEKSLCGDELDERSVLLSLLEDNQRRIDAGRRPQFAWAKEGGQLSLERAESPSAQSPAEIQAELASATGVPFENGRAVLRAPHAELGTDAATVAFKAALKDRRRAMAKTLRKRLSELDAFTFEKACVRMLHGHGFRELKVAKRNNFGPLMTGRKREGSVEIRFAIRLAKGNSSADRKQVQDLRRDMGNYAAQVGLLLSPGDPRGDARTEATHQGALAMLWCGEALAEKFFEAKAGVTVQTVELFEVDERFFETAKADGEEVSRRREERQRTRDQKLPHLGRAETEAQDSGDEGRAPGISVDGTSGEAVPADGEGAAESATNDLPAPPSESGKEAEHRRRRRRRRGRRGRPDRAPGTVASVEAVENGSVPTLAAPTPAEGSTPPPHKPPLE